MAYTDPTVANFKSQFQRDFPYGTDPSIAVLDSDITLAFSITSNQINQGLWGTQNEYQYAYLYLAAHYLVMNLRNSSQGLSGAFAWLTSSKGAGGISQGLSIPQRVLDNPNFAQYYTTNYGAMYLNLLWPNLTGQMFVAAGRPHP